MIDLPMDVQNGSLNGWSKEISKGTDKVTPISSEDQIINVSKIISKAERPVILVGQGVIISEAVEELRSLAESRNIPVAMSLLGLGVVSGNSPLSLGLLSGHTGNQFAAMAIYEADVLIVLSELVSTLDKQEPSPDQFSPDAKIIRVDLDEQELPIFQGKMSY